MRILIFENDYEAIQLSFELLNVLYYRNSLIIKQAPRYQDAGSIEDIIGHDFIFVDIDLAIGSKFDGFQIIKILLQNNYPLNRIAIITGHRDMRSRLKEQGIDDSIEVVYKAVTHKALYETLDKAFPKGQIIQQAV